MSVAETTNLLPGLEPLPCAAPEPPKSSAASDHTYERKETLLDVRNVSFSHGDQLVLKNVNFTVRNIVRPGQPQGQVCALLGPSGIGKTSLFRLLSGLEPLQTGEIVLANGMPVRRGLVGVVSQNYQLFNHRTVRSNLYIAARMGGKNDDQARGWASKYLLDFGLSDQVLKYPAQLSGGQRQRVAIAQQLLCSKDLLLMDEPFSGLDLVALRKVCHLITQVCREEETKTFFIVTHDIHAAIDVADTIYLMGRDRNPDGSLIPGARMMETIDLIERGLTWHSESQRDTPAYRDLVAEIESRFETL